MSFPAQNPSAEMKYEARHCLARPGRDSAGEQQIEAKMESNSNRLAGDFLYLVSEYLCDAEKSKFLVSSKSTYLEFFAMQGGIKNIFFESTYKGPFFDEEYRNRRRSYRRRQHTAIVLTSYGFIHRWHYQFGPRHSSGNEKAVEKICHLGISPISGFWLRQIHSIYQAKNSFFILDMNKRLYAFGNNRKKQLGIGIGAGDFIQHPLLIPALADINITSVCCDNPNIISATSDKGEVFIWGALNNGIPTRFSQPRGIPPVLPQSRVADGALQYAHAETTAEEVAAYKIRNQPHGNYISADGKLYTWYQEEVRAFSPFEHSEYLTHQQHIPLEKPIKSHHYLAPPRYYLGDPGDSAIIDNDGTIYTYGLNYKWLLGQGDFSLIEDVPIPRPVLPLCYESVTLVCSSTMHTVTVLTQSNRLFTWGKGLPHRDSLHEESYSSDTNHATWIGGYHHAENRALLEPAHLVVDVNSKILHLKVDDNGLWAAVDAEGNVITWQVAAYSSIIPISYEQCYEDYYYPPRTSQLPLCSALDKVHQEQLEESIIFKGRQHMLRQHAHYGEIKEENASPSLAVNADDIQLYKNINTLISALKKMEDESALEVLQEARYFVDNTNPEDLRCELHCQILKLIKHDGYFQFVAQNNRGWSWCTYYWSSYVKLRLNIAILLKVLTSYYPERASRHAQGLNISKPGTYSADGLFMDIIGTLLKSAESGGFSDHFYTELRSIYYEAVGRRARALRGAAGADLELTAYFRATVSMGLQNELKRVQEKNQEFEGKVARLEREKAELKNENAGLKGENAGLKGRIVELEHENEGLKKSISRRDATTEKVDTSSSMQVRLFGSSTPVHRRTARVTTLSGASGDDASHSSAFKPLNLPSSPGT